MPVFDELQHRRTSRRRRQLPCALLGLAVTTALLAGLAGPAQAASSACHRTDGAFTACSGGSAEWSDIAPVSFPGSGANLYADQADRVANVGGPGLASDTFMLLYDECGERSAPKPDEYILVSFKIVEFEDGAAKLQHYAVHLFGDDTIIVLENGKPQLSAGGTQRAAVIEGQHGAVGFGKSPQCSFNHQIGEYDIRLGASLGGVQAAQAGYPGQYPVEPPPPPPPPPRPGPPPPPPPLPPPPPSPPPGPAGYSPDPIYWNGVAGFGGVAFPNSPGDRDRDGVPDALDNCPGTPNASQSDANDNGIGDACERPPGMVLAAAAGPTVSSNTTAAFLSAGLHGTTAAESVPLALSKAPSLLTQISLIVEYRVAAHLTTSAQTLTRQLVHSLVEAGALSPAEEQALVAAVLRRVQDDRAAATRPLKVLSAKSDRRGRITIQVRVPASGTVSAVARSATKANSSKLAVYGSAKASLLLKRLAAIRITPAKSARRALLRKGRLRVVTKVTFKPTTGKSKTKKVTTIVRTKR